MSFVRNWSVIQENCESNLLGGELFIRLATLPRGRNAMERRRLKTKLAGVFHLGELSVGLTPEEQNSFDALVADGMDKQQAKGFVLGMRGDQSNKTMAVGLVVTVIGRT